ncbi:hypothetical protein ACIP66_02740 [Pseudomonas sp. NPDC088429]|uniref:hypothetical protein n=1 Tax=Pseudomonas sp. NPDC088429 TaxID=3364455 RepID=UPI003806A24F
MPMTEIVSDRPEVIERARGQMVRTVRRIDALNNDYVASMTMTGYFTALLIERMISHEMFDQLCQEMDHALDR